MAWYALNKFNELMSPLIVGAEGQYSKPKIEWTTVKTQDELFLIKYFNNETNPQKQIEDCRIHKYFWDGGNVIEQTIDYFTPTKQEGIEIPKKACTPGPSHTQRGTKVIPSVFDDLEDNDLPGLCRYTIQTEGIAIRPDLLPKAKECKHKLLKQEYLDDVLWTDNEEFFYRKWREKNPSDSTKDARFNDVMTFWDEARAKRETNKTDVDSAVDYAAVKAVTFDPTHIKTKTTIEAM